MIAIRQAAPSDAEALLPLIGLVWHDDSVEAVALARVTREREGCTLLVWDGERAVGFVDCFMTISEQGVPRWEVDLLAVEPEQRGRGIAASLIRQACVVGEQLGAQVARGLVHVENVRAQTAFRQAGFAADSDAMGLWVGGADERAVGQIAAPDGVYLHPVWTLTYIGLWIEGGKSPQGIAAARQVCRHYGWDTAGVLLPRTAQAPDGFMHVGDYHEWMRTL